MPGKNSSSIANASNSTTTTRRIKAVTTAEVGEAAAPAETEAAVAAAARMEVPDAAELAATTVTVEEVVIASGTRTWATADIAISPDTSTTNAQTGSGSSETPAKVSRPNQTQLRTIPAETASAQSHPR